MAPITALCWAFGYCWNCVVGLPSSAQPTGYYGLLRVTGDRIYSEWTQLPPAARLQLIVPMPGNFGVAVTGVLMSAMDVMSAQAAIVGGGTTAEGSCNAGK